MFSVFRNLSGFKGQNVRRHWNWFRFVLWSNSSCYSTWTKPPKWNPSSDGRSFFSLLKRHVLLLKTSWLELKRWVDYLISQLSIFIVCQFLSNKAPKNSLVSSLSDLIDKVTISRCQLERVDECSWRWSLAAGSASPENFRNQMYSSWRVKQPKQQECKWRSLFLSEFRRVRTESHNLKKGLRPNLTQTRPGKLRTELDSTVLVDWMRIYVEGRG